MRARERTADMCRSCGEFSEENATSSRKSQKLLTELHHGKVSAIVAPSSKNKVQCKIKRSDSSMVLKCSTNVNVREVLQADEKSSGSDKVACKVCGTHFELTSRNGKDCQRKQDHIIKEQDHLCPRCMVDGELKPILDSLSCERCGREDQEESMLVCDACDRGFHMHCLAPILVAVPKGRWFCPHCVQKPKSISEFPLVQTKIIDFFKISRCQESSAALKRKRRPGRSILRVSKRKRALMAHRPSAQPERRLQQLASLATAVISSGMQFSDELTYGPDLAPRSANNTKLEIGGMQVMGKADRAAYDAFKDMCRKGQCPPLMLKYDSVQGWVVEADDPIPDWTLVAEYTGDVDFIRKRLHDDGDSMMELLRTKNPNDALVICPHVRGNIGRFFSGINNHSRDGRKKINLRAVRFDIDGQAKVFLVAIRDIRRGEKLYYDYNGLSNGYPTEHFV